MKLCNARDKNACGGNGRWWKEAVMHVVDGGRRRMVMLAGAVSFPSGDGQQREYW